MSAFEESDVHEQLWGKTECPYCGRYVACLAHHRCSTEQALPIAAPVVDRPSLEEYAPAALEETWKG